MTLPIRVIAALGLVLLTTGQVRAEQPPVAPTAAAFFERRVRPVLAEHCQGCHGPSKQRGGLRLDSLAAVLRGGDAGPALVPGKPDESLLIKAIRHQGGLKMPPRNPLKKQHIEDLAGWVRLGAPWPGASRASAPARSETSLGSRDRAHWSFQRVQRPALPTLRNPGWVANPIDAFVLARLEARGLEPSAPVSRRQLIRRVSFDLIGLPPSPEEVDAFLDDNSPNAYERLVDRLLASPRYGERWGRHWLDVVRFAQTNGYERDSEKPNAWRYRDYVIQSFNDDKPYDRFVLEQLAGDELDPATDAARTATAFYRLGVWDDEPDDLRQAEFDNLDDMLSTTGEAFLGLTLGCARCHDHKFDPISQEDYYSLLAFLRNIKPYRDVKIGDNPMQLPLRDGRSTLAVKENGPAAPATHILIAGQAARQGKKVEPRFLHVLGSPEDPAPPDIRPTRTTSGRRRALANWIASPDNPLTARVMVNRLWHWHFGRGLVDTPSDFGRNGSAPSHPELLDWLASELVAGGWKLERIHKLIVTSSTYRQSAGVRPGRTQAVDPGNRLLWRQNLRRLEAEAIRDAVLAASGELTLTMGGRGVFPVLPREVLETQSRPGEGWYTSPPAEQGRRSVYIFVKRTLGVPLLETFDFASPDKAIATRTTTTIAPQALILYNSAFVEEQAAAFAARLIRESGQDPEGNLDRAFRLALGRSATVGERQIALAWFGRTRAAEGQPDSADAYRRALAGLCKLVLNLNEFVYVD
jgi:hypothetical protein